MTGNDSVDRAVYLDYNATAPLAPSVAAAMQPWMLPNAANPGAVHQYGRAARAATEHARAQVAEFCGLNRSRLTSGADQVVFTSGGTEADNMALWGCLGWPPRGHLVISAVEHPAIAEPCEALTALGVEVSVVGVDHSGRVRLDELADALRADTRLVSVMAANNEVGTLQPIREICRIAHDAGARVHCDAVQAGSWIDLGTDLDEVDLLSVTAHKMGGPPGIGALVLRDSAAISLQPILRGGGQQGGHRGGTEPTALIVGMGATCERAVRRHGEESARVGALSRRLCAELTARVPDCYPTCPDPELRLPNTVHLCFDDCNGAVLVARLDLDGISASAGSACASGLAHASPVLSAMGISPSRAAGSLRLSLGYGNTEADIDRAIDIIPDAVKEIRSALRANGASNRPTVDTSSPAAPAAERDAEPGHEEAAR